MITNDLERAKAYSNLFSSDVGKMVREDMERLFSRRTIYGLDGKGMTDLQLAYKEGQRFVTTWIDTFIELGKHPERLVQKTVEEQENADGNKG